ncbi:hypothetical protein B4U84_24530 [Westiellopsis prolifica IICB1]|nr:hypothetical protein B4U84_24530 [Westiellopsis prolifica IICB1]
MSKLQEMLNFIEKIESENFGKSSYEIANHLRGYTKAEYTTRLWTLATGYNQKYIEGEFKGKLNQELVLSGENLDFAHFIASLSDQINSLGMSKSDLTSWTGDHTSWAGDIGSAIIFYRSKSDKTSKTTLNEVLKNLASDSDYTANITAYLVGLMLNSDPQVKISKAIYQYDTIEYSQHIKTFIQRRFDGIIEGNKIKNPAAVEAEIRRSISTFIRLYTPANNLFKSVKNLVKLQPKLEWENTTEPNGSDLLTGSLHFLTHIVKYGGLESLYFQPYQMPGLPWLGTVDYFVSVPISVNK